MPRQAKRATKPKTLVQLVRQLMDQGQSRREATAHAKKIISEVDRFVVDGRGRLKPAEPGPSIFAVERKTRTKKGGA